MDNERGVSIRENNWEYARTAWAGADNWYAYDRAEALLSWCEAGIGIL